MTTSIDRLECNAWFLYWLLLYLICMPVSVRAESGSSIETDLLIVGGTESGCAAALQAARMGVESITIVNDIDWLGGQFSAEGLVAIDENRGPEGYGHGVPFPRSGIFLEIMEAIEEKNRKKFGVPRPGNTRVITTCLPEDAEKVFRDLLTPYIDKGQIQIISDYYPVEVITSSQLTKVDAVRFKSVSEASVLTVQARLTIDASDWGDVIKLSGAEYDYGPDLKEKYEEPLAPESREDYPVTDMNPITYCMVLKESVDAVPIARPTGFDRSDYDGLPYPKDPSWIYESRRLVDHRHFKSVPTKDAVLLCFPAFDYPLDVYPQTLQDQLNAMESGAGNKNIVELTREQRQVVFADAKQRSLGFLYYLQHVVHDQASKPELNFRQLKLSDEFATKDHLPPKPYTRESLRLKAMYQLKQQDTTGFANDARNYATAMFHDPIACWQFEYDFHPTKRQFLDGDTAGPWHPQFRKNRTWGPPYSGKAQFPLRSLVPIQMDGLLGAQKNLGYTSIVSSAVRLHDQSVAIGQGCGAVAAISLRHGTEPRQLTWDRNLLSEIWDGLLTAGPVPQTLWPFGDLDPRHPSFVAVNQLAVRRLIPVGPYDIEFHADQLATEQWQEQFVSHINRQGVELSEELSVEHDATRGDVALAVWKHIKSKKLPNPDRQQSNDADGDLIIDTEDPLPWKTGSTSWDGWLPPPDQDGLPDEELLNDTSVTSINFAKAGTTVARFQLDHGAPFDTQRQQGWSRDISHNQRTRHRYPEVVRDTFLFTRSHDVWEKSLPNGTYRVTLCCGDAAHEQFGQNVTVEGLPIIEDATTPAGSYLEKEIQVEVKDGKLTVEIGAPGKTTNTCLNWMIIQLTN